MRILTEENAQEILQSFETLAAEGDSHLLCAVPPIFTLPKTVLRELTANGEHAALPVLWKRSVSLLRRYIKRHRLCLTLLTPELAMLTPDMLRPPLRR